jgi:carboxypeptidase C (cathepsin A)
MGAGYSYTEEASALVRSNEQALVDLFVVLKVLADKEIPTLQHGPLCTVEESYGSKLGAIFSLALKRAIRAGMLSIML